MCSQGDIIKVAQQAANNKAANNNRVVVGWAINRATPENAFLHSQFGRAPGMHWASDGGQASHDRCACHHPMII